MKKKSIVMVVLGIMLACAALAELTSMPGVSFSPAPVASASADASAFVAQGKDRLAAHDIIGARDAFKQATLADPASQEAQFLYGVTRILALYEEGQGLTTLGLDSIREIAELTGFSFTSYGLYGTEETAPDELAATTPSTGAVIDFLVAKALPEIDGAIANLSAVTDPAFISTLQAEGLNKTGVGPFSADYGDVLAIRSLVHLAKCNVELFRTYGLNVSLPPIVNGDREQLMLYRQLLQNDAGLLAPRDPSRLPHAKTALIGFIDSFNQAVAAVKARSTVDGHLFVLDVPLTDSPFDTTTPDVDEVRKALAEIKASLSVPTQYSFAGSSSSSVVDLSKFFNSVAPINFRSKLADCTGGTVLPDPTLGGMFPLGLGDVQADLIPVRADIRGIACSTFTAPNLSFDTDYRFFYEDLYYGFKSPPALFSLNNKGTADLAITSISLVGSDRNDFTLSAGTCSSLTPTLAPGTSCSVEVDFMPTSGGSKGAALEVVSNDPDSPRVYANLSGQAMLMTDTPRPGAVTALVASTGTPATLYAARYGEGVFKSSDGGVNWVNVTTNLGSNRVKALWLDPVNPQVVVAGTFGKGIYKSTNGGTFWTASNSGLNHLFVTTLSGSTSSSSVIYAVTHGGLFKSTNAGGAWVEVDMGLTDDVVRTVSVTSQSPENLYACSQSGGVFKSTNGGSDWTQLVLPAWTYASAISVSPADGNTIFVGTYSSVYRSNDGGFTWMPLPVSGPWVNGIVISPVAPATIYVSSYNGVTSSADNGATWLQMGLPGSVTALVADRTSPTGVYAGLTEGVIYRSTDSGTHWDWLSRVGSVDSSVNVRSFAYDPETLTTVYAGIEGRGVYKSIDGGASWNPANNGLGDVGVWAVATVPHAPGVVLAGGYSGIYRSTDDAANWTATNLTSDVYHLFASSANPSVIFASTSSGVYKSTDQGASWQTVGLNGYFRRVAVSELNPSMVYALSLNDLYKSADGGATWNKVYSTPYEPWGYRISAVTLAIDPASASTVYLATSSGLYKSTDGGVTMFPANNGLVQYGWMPFVSDLLVIAPGSLLAAADSTIFKTTDGAASWSSLNTGVYSPNTLALASGASYLLVGNSEGIYRVPLPSETPPPSYPLSISLVGAGTVETSTGLFCDSGVCNDSYVDGTDVILTPYPGQSSSFAGWTGCDSLSGDECRVKMTSARSVTATFTVDTTPLQVMVFPASGSYEAPLSVSIIANKEAAIYYTLDGTTPTPSSQPYLGPITLESSKTLNFIAVDAMGQSQVQTRTYSILSAADFSWAGVVHVSRSDGTQKDALDVGLTGLATSLAGMTLAVNGPNGFAYSFTDADITPNGPGIFSLYKEFASLAPGQYSFTLQDGKGRIAQRFDSHVTPDPIPVLDATTIKYQRRQDTSYRFRWAPVNAPKNYYRLRITTPAGSPVFTGTRKHGTYEDVPAGVLQDGLAYRYRVEAFDGPTIDLAYNRSNSSYTDFTPTPAHYDPNLPIFTWAALHNRIEADGSAFVLATFAVDRPETVTFAELTGPNSFRYVFNLTGDYTAQYKEFSKKLSPPLTAGTYTFHVTAGGVEHYLTAPLTAAVTYPAPDTATMQARDLGNGSIRFSWADVNTNGALYYRIYVQDTQTGSSITTSRQNQTYVDVATSDITNKSWRVEVHDSSDVGTVRNRRNGTLIPLVVQPADATKPVLNYFRIRNASKPDGSITTEFQMSGSDADGTVSALTVNGPSGIAYDLMKEGWKYATNYRLDRAGSSPQGLYALKAVDNSGKSDTRYAYQPAPAPVPVVDYRTFRVNQRLNGDLEFSWAPAGAAGPYWYWLDLFTVADRDGDGKPDPVSLQVTPTQTSFRIPSAALPAEPLMFRVVAADGSNFTTINNASYSITVGYHGAGYDYGSLTDGDGDGYASDIDGNDANAATTPFSSRKLRVTLSGTGEGAVNSIPSLLACDAGTCEATVDAGMSLLLRAFPDSLSLFNGWQGSCINGIGDCSLTMDGDRSVTAIFTLDAPIRLAGQAPQYFATLAAAYAAAGTTATLEARGREYNENFTLNRNVSLIFRGGLDNSFNPTSGSSVLKGVLTIGSGSLVVDKLVIQ